MADDTEDININLNTNIPEQSADSIKSVVGLKKAYKDAMNEMAKGTKGAAERAAELKDRLEDLKDETQSLKGSGIEKLTSSMTLLKDGFVNADPGKLGIAMKGLGAAMKAIPIFLIIEGIRYLVENFEKLSKGGGILGKVFTFIGDVIGAVIQAFKDLSDWLGLTNFAVEDNAEKTIEAAKSMQAATTERYDSEIKLAKAAGKDTLELEIKKQQAIIDSTRIQFEAIKAVAAANGEVTDEQVKKVTELGTVIKNAQLEIDTARVTAETKATEDAKKVGEERRKIAEDNAKKLRDLEVGNIQDTYLQKRTQIINQYTDEAEKYKGQNEILVQLGIKRDQEIKKLNEEKYADEEKSLKEFQSIKALIPEQEAKMTAVAQKAEVLAYKDHLTTLEKLQSLSTEQRIASINSLANSAQTILTAINDFNQAKADEAVKLNEEGLATQLGSLEAARNEELNQEGLTADQKIAIENKYKQKKYDLELAEYNNSTKIKKKAFEQDKKMKIAMAILSTITGAISAFTGMLSVPIIGIALGVIAAAAVVAAGALNIAKIQNTTFDAGTPPSPITATPPSMSSAGGGAGGENSSPSATPSFDLFKNDTNQNGANNNASNNSSNQPTVVKAYVVSQEITDQQTANNYSASMGTL